MKMLFTHVIVNTNEAALTQRERTFNRIGVNITARIFLRAMTNGIMARVLHANTPISGVFIRDDRHFNVHHVADCIFQSLTSHICNNATVNSTVTLDRSKYGGLFCSASALAYAFVARLTANLRFVAGTGDCWVGLALSLPFRSGVRRAETQATGSSEQTGSAPGPEFCCIRRAYRRFLAVERYDRRL